MEAKQILVTGGAGYIGSHTVVELVAQGYNVSIVDDLSCSEISMLEGIQRITGKKVDFHQFSCSNEQALEALFIAKKFESVIHFAAFKSVGDSVKNPLAYYENNVGALLVLTKVMLRHKVSDIIFSSSCTVYGEPEYVPVDEHTSQKPAQSPYGATKQMCERILSDCSSLGLRTIALRYFNPIGAHPSAHLGELPIGTPNNLVPFVTQTAAGIREQLAIFGNDYATKDGSCIRDFIHVVDLAKAHVKALDYVSKQKQTGLFHAFNIGTGVGVSVLELVKLFEKVTNQQLKYTIGSRRAGDVERVYANPALAKEKLLWQANLSLADALSDAWRWERKLRNI
jgi:UDP-glucose 4-epimerase